MFRDQLVEISLECDVVLVRIQADVYDTRMPSGNYEKDCDVIMSVTIRAADPKEKRQKSLLKVLYEQEPASRRDNDCYSTWYVPHSHRCTTVPSPVRLPQLDLSDEVESKYKRTKHDFSSSSSVCTSVSAASSCESACSHAAADNTAPGMLDVDENETEVKFTPTKSRRK